MEASVAEWSEAEGHVEGEGLREGGQGPEHVGPVGPGKEFRVLFERSGKPY